MYILLELRNDIPTEYIAYIIWSQCYAPISVCETWIIADSFVSEKTIYVAYPT